MKNGFSLVELSIVLVILGLLTGGILAGQSLIRASELRSVIADYQRFSSATQTFRDKYLAVPGDMRNATRFWNRNANVADCVTNSSASVSTPGACDGDGDADIDAPSGASKYGEFFGFWQHLANAGLIEGNYSGIAGSGGGGHAVAGTNVPAGKISSSAWGAQGLGVYAGFAGDMYAMDYGNVLMVGATMTNNLPANPLFKPEEVWGIDVKLDDGKPGYGNVISRYYSSCTTGTVSQTDFSAATYNLSSTSIACVIYFRKFV